MSSRSIKPGYKMAASLERIGTVSSHYVFYLVLSLQLLINVGLSADARCVQNCTCVGDSVDCSKLDWSSIPLDLPVGTVSLNLGHNKFTSINYEALANLPNLRELRLDHNELTSIPELGQAASTVALLYLHHNKIRSIDGTRTRELVSVETLDLSNNDITELRTHCFPAGLRIKDLYLSSNKINVLELGCLDHLGSTLQALRLSRNRIGQVPVRAFQLPGLTQLELNRNRIRQIEGLTFQGLSSLEVLKLQRNNISKLTDGAFWDLAKMKILHLDYNSLREVNSGSLYGLSSLQQLFLSNNSIAHINPDGWKFCQKLRELNLSYNNLTRLDEGSLAVLGELHSLRLGHNSISHVAEGSFRGLKSLRVLELDHNDISGTIEDTNGAFSGLDSLNRLTLFGNKIKSVAKKAFSGLDTLEHLNLGENTIRSIQPDAFSKMRSLKMLFLQSDSFLCDCQLQWLPEWLTTRRLQAGVNATCAHPETLKGTSIFHAPATSFVCDDLPKPQITVQPSTTVTVLGSDVRLTCTAASSSSSPVTFAWRKDQELLHNGDMENFARAHDTKNPKKTQAATGASASTGASAQVAVGGNGVMEYTTILHLRHVTFAHEGRYQCIITNHFGSSYSDKARLTVNVLPSFLKTPRDSTIRTGHTARLECAAEGHPAPQIAWQKDGGTDFPAARERRMHVMPDDDVFFITDVKPEDMGVYSCTARNTAGLVSANASLTVLETPHLAQELTDRTVAVGDTVALQCKALGSPPPRISWLHNDQPLRPSDHLHFTPGNQLLVIGAARPEDAGRYTCLMSNTLGTERGHIYLGVSPSANCDTGASYEPDGWTTVGIVVMVVVCCVVGTSLVWVIVIYHMRRKSEDYSITNTDEMNLPADIPSYLSSQGTLSEPQEGYSNSEAGSHQQLMPPLSNGYAHKGTDGVFYGDTGLELDNEGGALHCRVGSLFPSRSSFQPGERPRGDGPPGAPTGGAGSLVICSDCYDNANIYSRTREYCPYAYLGAEEDDVGLRGPPREDATLEGLISQQDPSSSSSTTTTLTSSSYGGLLPPSHGERPGGPDPGECYAADPASRSFWGEGKEPVVSQLPAPLAPPSGHRPEEEEEEEEEEEQRQQQQHSSSSSSSSFPGPAHMQHGNHTSGSHRTNTQGHPAPS